MNNATITRVLETLLPQQAVWLEEGEQLTALTAKAEQLSKSAPDRILGLMKDQDQYWVQPTTGEEWVVQRHILGSIPQIKLLTLVRLDPFEGLLRNKAKVQSWAELATAWRFEQGHTSDTNWHAFSTMVSQPILPEVYKINDAINLLQQELSKLPEGKQLGNRLQLQLNTETNGWVDIDIKATALACANLVKNAYETLVGSISFQVIVTKASEPYLEIRIIHTHQGDKIVWPERATEPFISTKQGRAGLGLAQALRVMTLHDGVMELKHSPYGLVTFLRFPIQLDVQT